MSSWTEEQLNEADWDQAFELGKQEQRDNDFSLLTNLEKKEQVKLHIREQILNGQINPLEFYRQAKIVECLVDELKNDPDIKDMAQTEREKYGKEKPSINGSVVDTGQRVTYDYGSCGDPVYDKLKEDLKARESLLKALPPEGMVVTDQQTGETIKIMPPVQKISTFVTVKI